MKYRLNKDTLLDILEQWNGFIRRKVHLIACGGTAITLMGIKPSTKDVDFIVSIEKEYKYLIKVLKDLGYKQSTGSGWSKKGEVFIFDLFSGKRIHTTELLISPLEDGKHTLFKEFSHLYIGILNDFDLIASKLSRGIRVDFEDCLMLIGARKGKFDVQLFIRHFKELASYDVSENRMIKNLESLLDLLKKEKLYGK